MKKSIFLFFAAILCAMNVSAWSYKTAANSWKASTSGFTTVTMNSGKSMSVVMLKDVGDGVNICQNDDGNGQKLYCKWTKTSGDIFRGTARWNSGLYSDETVVIPGGIVYIKVGSGAQVQMTAGADYTYTADVTFSTTGESYTIFGGTVNGATIKNEDSMPAGGKPSTLTMSNSYTSKKSGNVHIVFDLKTNKVTETAASEPEPEPTPEVYTVVGSSAEIFGSAWTPSATANDMTKQADGTYKLVKENVTLAAGNIEYKVVKDHNWGTGEFPSPGNESFKIDESGVYDITFTYTVGSKLTAEKTLKESAVVLPTIELAGTMNGCDDWGACKKALTPADDKLKASITVTLAQQEYSFKIVKAGEWLGNKGKMERNSSTGWTFEKLDGGDETNCRIVADIAGDYTFTWTYETNKLTVTYPELPTPEYKDITVTVYAKEVPNIWWWNGGDKCADADDAYDWDTAPAMEAVVIDGNTWYQKTFKDVDVALGGIKFKLKSQDQSKGSNELQTTEDKCYDARVITAITETLCGQLPTGETPKVTYNVEVPAGTNTCYIAGEMNGWTLTEMTKVDDIHYTITIEGATTAHKYKYASGPDSDWKYVEVKADGSDVSNRTYNANDVVEKWKSVYDPSAPAETKYYIAGAENLTGFNWQVDGLEIKKVGDVYKHTFSELPDGIYEFKITDGTWEHQWNYYNLGAAYEEVSEGTDGDGNPNGNIKFTTEEAKNITVIFEPATGKITIDGLTEKVVEAPKCYLMGNGDWTTGVEMTVNPDNDNEFMFLNHEITSAFKFKYGEEWTDQVENSDFPGIDWVDDGNGQYNITLPAGIYDFYFKKDAKNVYIAAVYLRDVTYTWGTICLPHASTSFSGAKFYEVSSLDPTKGLWLDEIEAGTQLAAGKPYVFEATGTTVKVTYTDAAKSAPVEGKNGLTGTFTDIAADGDLVGNYIIAENKVWVAGESATLPAYRAYISSTVPTTAQAEIPGRRRVCMGENAATGLDQIVAPAGQAVKVIENGQLIIIRDGVKYNVQGQVIR